MRAAVLSEVGGHLTLEEIPKPSPKAGEVLIKVAACGVCHMDLHVMKGEVKFPLPCVFGHEISGVVAEVAPDVKTTRPGEVVVCSFIMPCGVCYYCVRGRDDLCETFFAMNRLKGTLYDGESRLRRSDGAPLAMYSMGGLAELDHPAVRAISFVGSTPVARYVYSRATANGKRAQCQGGAKNPLIVLPDAALEEVVRIAADSAFGCAGQRCLAASLAIAVDEAKPAFTQAMAEVAVSRRVGYGLNEGVEMGPVIRAESKTRIESLIQAGVEEDAKVVVDGRSARIPGYEQGYFLQPTILEDVNPGSQLAQTEIFGPVLGVMSARDIDEAIALVNRHHYGNMACLFTRSGAAARKFRYEAQVGNIGINVGVAAPMAFFPFCGWKESFFGDLHAQGRDAVEFYTEKKVVVERWPKA